MGQDVSMENTAVKVFVPVKMACSKLKDVLPTNPATCLSQNSRLPTLSLLISHFLIVCFLALLYTIHNANNSVKTDGYVDTEVN